MEILTPSDWWNVVDDNWMHLRTIIHHQINVYEPATESPGDGSINMTGRSIALEIERLKEHRDQRLCRYFFAAWDMASDAYAWSVPGWSELCDLCSEEWVFDQDLLPLRPNA